MVERYRPGQIEAAAAPRGLFLERRTMKFIPTGCTLLNCIISGHDGGWPQGRIINIIGDKSTGKTLLAEEGMANLIRLFPKAKKPKYRESEAAFDTDYVKALGVDPDSIDFGPEGPDTQWQTIEEVVDDLLLVLEDIEADVDESIAVLVKKRKIKKDNKKKLLEVKKEVLQNIPPTVYIIDSLDALSDEEEMKRNISDGSYNLKKQKVLNSLFRQYRSRLRAANVTLIIISQTRDRIGAMIRGKKYRRQGEKPLDFYSSVVLYLSDLGKVKETIKGIERKVAVKVRVKVEKNKVYMPHRECEFEIRFGYGVDDDWACLDFLKSVKRLDAIGLKDLPKNLKNIDIAELKKQTVKVWQEIEKSFTPPKGKYA